MAKRTRVRARRPRATVCKVPDKSTGKKIPSEPKGSLSADTAGGVALERQSSDDGALPPLADTVVRLNRAVLEELAALESLRAQIRLTYRRPASRPPYYPISALQ